MCNNYFSYDSLQVSVLGSREWGDEGDRGTKGQGGKQNS